RKEATDALDDAQLRTLEERLRYLRELEERRTAVLDSIRAQGKLDAVLEAQILVAGSKARLEDIYLPYKPKRRTKAQIAREARLGVADRGRPADRWLADTVRWAWRTRILVHLGIDMRTRLWQAAEDEAVRVFAANLRDLLLAAPAGTRATMGLDPGFRTGVKVAVVDATGKVVATGTIYPHVPARKWDK